MLELDPHFYDAPIMVTIITFLNWQPESVLTEDGAPCINPISIGVLENQDMMGGSIWPSSKSHVWCPIITNETLLESSCALLLESAKNLQICKNWIFLLQNPVVK